MSQKSDLQVLVSEIEAKIVDLKSAVDALPESDEELQKKIDELLLENASLKGELDAAKAVLADIDLKAKAIDASIPDAPVPEVQA